MIYIREIFGSIINNMVVCVVLYIYNIFLHNYEKSECICYEIYTYNSPKDFLLSAIMLCFVGNNTFFFLFLRIKTGIILIKKSTVRLNYIVNMVEHPPSTLHNLKHS